MRETDSCQSVENSNHKNPPLELRTPTSFVNNLFHISDMNIFFAPCFDMCLIRADTIAALDWFSKISIARNCLAGFKSSRSHTLFVHGPL